jgi:probable rRNA maturation factor
MNYLDIQVATQAPELPDSGQIQCWVDAVLADVSNDSEIVLRIVDEAESAALNQQYRHKAGSTNILSFPSDLPEDVELDADWLGDLVVCAPVLAREAQEQHKRLHDHWAHIVIHGILHLLGYDHIEPEDAEAMEALEIRILQQLDINNPYLVTEQA